MALPLLFWTRWPVRRATVTADYDDRAYDSPIPLQRYWQRARYGHVTDLAAGCGAALDVGCGSSRILGALPPGSVGLDILLGKLHHARKFDRPLVHGDALRLPFPDASFPCVVCSEVIEHIPLGSPVLDELTRVLAPGGRLVIGTPDYARWEWVALEILYRLAAPGGYADGHIARYTRASLTALLAQRGLTLEEVRYVGRGEMILALRQRC